jgi:hypothetical protein
MSLLITILLLGALFFAAHRSLKSQNPKKIFAVSAAFFLLEPFVRYLETRFL